MKEVSAVDIRKSLGRLARRLERDEQPILLKVGRRPVGVIVSLRDFSERFALHKAEDERKRLVEEILSDTRRGTAPVDRVLRELRDR